MTSAAPAMLVDFCGETFPLDPDARFTIGRDADLNIDENPYLHRRFLEVAARGELWWLANVGSQLAATLSDGEGRVQAWLAPGSALPIVFDHTSVRFSAGPTAYELSLLQAEAPFSLAPSDRVATGTTTLGQVLLTPEQRLLVVALAEPLLRRPGTGAAALPSTADAAARLGWPVTKFNRKLDNVCQKLKKSGVQGLHGNAGQLASTRRARLVEYALAVGLVGPDDVALLDTDFTEP